MGVGQFGPSVIGQKAFDAERKMVKQGQVVFGPAVIPRESETAKTIASMSVEKVKELLVANPALVDELYTAELSRPSGPRQTALQALLVAERSKGETGEEDSELAGRIKAALETA